MAENINYAPFEGLVSCDKKTAMLWYGTQLRGPYDQLARNIVTFRYLDVDITETEHTFLKKHV